MKWTTIMLMGFVFLFSGCVQTHYTKSVSVKKDADGKIIERVETEAVVQPGSGWPVKYEHLKDVQP